MNSSQLPPPSSRSISMIRLYLLLTVLCLIGAVFFLRTKFFPSSPSTPTPLTATQPSIVVQTNSPTPTSSISPETSRMPTSTTVSQTPTSISIDTPTPAATHVITVANGEIRIGIVTDREGRDNGLGDAQQIGVELAKPYLKEVYGVEIVDAAQPCSQEDEKPHLCLRFIHRITDSGVDSAVEAFETLIYTDHVAIIIGPTYSAQAEQAHKIADEAGVPVIAISNTADGIVDLPHIVRVSAPVSAYAHFAFKAIQANAERVAIVYQNDDPFTVSEGQTFIQAVRELRGPVLALEEPYPSGFTNFRSLAEKIYQEEPNLVIVSARFRDGIDLIKALDELGYSGLLIGGNGLNVNGIFDACGVACSGMYIAQAYNPNKQENSVQKAFIDLYFQQNHSGLPSQITAQMFTALQMLVEILKEQEEIASALVLQEVRDKLTRQLLTMERGIDTPLGYIWLDQHGEVCQSEFYVAQVKIASNDETSVFDTITGYPVTNIFGKLCYSE